MTSADSDQVSVFDYTAYHDTGENWPVREGYGALLAQHAAGLPVSLNCAVERIDVATRTVEASIPFQFEDAAAVMILRADPQGGVLLGCSQGIYEGHRVLLLPEAP